MQRRVVSIGAGLSGLVAANELQAAGAEIAVLDLHSSSIASTIGSIVVAAEAHPLFIAQAGSTSLAKALGAHRCQEVVTA